jgi:hypothetical protein
LPLLPDVPLPDAAPDGLDGDFFGCCVELPVEPLVELLLEPLGDAVLPLPALPSGRSQPARTPARASARTTESVRFMVWPPWKMPEGSNKRAGICPTSVPALG